MPKEKGVPQQNYGEASKLVGKAWQEYKSKNSNSVEKLDYNQFRKEFAQRQLRSNIQRKKSDDIGGHSIGNDNNNTKSSSGKINMEHMDIVDDNTADNLANSSNTGHGGSPSANNTSSPIWLSNGGGKQHADLTFRKKRIFYTYGYSFRVVDVAQTAADYPHSGIATPLANLWVDYLPSYLNNAEFLALPTGSIAKEARVNVKLLGSRTSFEVGSSLSGFANSEHVPIGIIATNINNTTYGKNVSYTTSDATRPMVPTGIEEINNEHILKKYYNDLPSMAMGVPRSAYGYWWYRQNKDIPIVDGGNQQPFKYGQLNLQEYSERFLINSAIGQTIKSYKYSIKHGLLTFPKHHVTNNAYNNSDLDIMNGAGLTSKINVQRTRNNYYASVLGQATEKCTSINTDNMNGVNILTDYFDTAQYTRTLERPVVYNPRNPYDNSCRFAQPQLHVGMLATPQLSPATELENFQLSTVYYEVEYELDVGISLNSYYTDLKLTLSPDSVIFYNNYGTGYTTGATFCGIDDEYKRGKVTTNHNKKATHSSIFYQRQGECDCELRRGRRNDARSSDSILSQSRNGTLATHRHQSRSDNVLQQMVRCNINSKTSSKSNESNDSGDNESDYNSKNYNSYDNQKKNDNHNKKTDDNDESDDDDHDIDNKKTYVNKKFDGKKLVITKPRPINILCE